MPTVYQGEVEVEDADFTMEFERFIIGENYLSFQGGGCTDEYGKFYFEGRGERDAEGQYRIVPMLQFPEFPAMGGYSGTIVIEELRPSSSRRKCTVRGYWLDEEGSRWSISAEKAGKLTLFET